jgi:hypothetical protein
MRSMIAVFALLMALILPVSVIASQELTTEQGVVDVVRWAGCNASVVTSEGVSIRGSFYNSWEKTLYIGRDQSVQGQPAPYYAGLLILFHEIGHCLQDQEGVLGQVGDGSQAATELDADRRAVDLACLYNLDGPEYWQELWQWIYDTTGYSGDENHGTIEERYNQVTRATYCADRAPEVRQAQ